jgi:hypothetical protein
MPTSIVKAHTLKPSEPGRRVTENSDARRQALDWIADQLRWERTLDALRAGSTRR